MQSNRSMPTPTMIPVLGYPDVGAAVTWLARAFGFIERLRVGDHRAQLTLGDDVAVVVRKLDKAVAASTSNHALMIRVLDVDSHHARAKQLGAVVLQGPTDCIFGERQYTVIDPGGHHWTFSQTTTDVAPETWGGVLR